VGEEDYKLTREIIEYICIVEQWVSADVRSDRGEEKWLNLILQITDLNWRLCTTYSMKYLKTIKSKTSKV